MFNSSQKRVFIMIGSVFKLIVYNLTMGISVFGDSIASGHWDTQGGWVVRLAKYLTGRCLKSNYKEWFSVSNFSISGATSTDLLARFPAEAKALGWEESIFLFAIGLNDSVVKMRSGRCVTPLPRFIKNLAELTRMARKYTQNLAFVGLAPVQDEVVFPMEWDPSKGCRTKEIEIYNRAIKEVAIQAKADFIDLYPVLTTKGVAGILADGAHPNNLGHEIIYKEVRKYLKKEDFI